MDEEQALRLMAAVDTLEAMRNPPEPPVTAETSGPVEDALIGAGHWFAQRVPGMDSSIPPPDTAAASIGKALPLLPASFLLPGSGLVGMAAQGGLNAAGEAIRTGSTRESVLKEGLLGAAFTGGADLAGRTLSGMGSRVMQAIRGMGKDTTERIIRTQSQRLRTISETLGGMGAFNRAQQRVIDRSAARAIGETADSLTPTVRAAAAKRIGEAMDAALPVRPVDVTEAFTVIDDIPAEVLPGKSRVLALIQKAESDPRAYQDASRALREAGRRVARSPNAAFADEVHVGLESLTRAGEVAGAANTRVAREQWKNLVTLEGIPALRRTGSVPALAAESALFRSYGGTVSREQGAGLLKESETFYRTIQEAAEEAAQRFRSSGTAERVVGAGAAGDALGLLTGTTSPSAAIRGLGTVLGVGPLAGAAAVGRPIPGAGQLGAAAARRAGEDE